jgi:hypothetical protein
LLLGWITTPVMDRRLRSEIQSRKERMRRARLVSTVLETRRVDGFDDDALRKRTPRELRQLLALLDLFEVVLKAIETDLY